MRAKSLGVTRHWEAFFNSQLHSWRQKSQVWRRALLDAFFPRLPLLPPKRGANRARLAPTSVNAQQ
jgi:hypothetical protein